ncbi:MAG TPA: Ldh family oxidoreductase [Chloroflexota bacterium]|nr:Ldh family oxidoreductase [Chloroflexota bacterium]
MESVRIRAEELREIVEALFRKAGVSAEDAATIARVQVEADLRGIFSHGTRAVPTYLERIRRGIINPRPNVVVNDFGAVAVVEGDDGPGQMVACRAMEECIARARKYHVGIALARRSNHFGAAGYYAGLAAADDLIGLATTNGNLVLAPPGSVTPTVGNNPIAVGVPAGEEYPLLLDVAMSVVAGGKVDLAAAEGTALPEGWCYDADGQPTRDLSRALAGLGVPLGAPLAGHKGFGLAIAMEVLAGALTGAAFGREHTLEVEAGPRPWNEGHFFLAIDPAVSMPLPTFKSRVDQLIREIRASAPLPNGDTPHAPGEHGWRRRDEALRDGILLPGSVMARLREAERQTAH